MSMEDKLINKRQRREHLAALLDVDRTTSAGRLTN